MRKADVLQALQERGIYYDERISAVEAKVLLRKWVNENVKAAIVLMAEDAQHSGSCGRSHSKIYKPDYR